MKVRPSRTSSRARAPLYWLQNMHSYSALSAACRAFFRFDTPNLVSVSLTLPTNAVQMLFAATNRRRWPSVIRAQFHSARQHGPHRLCRRLWVVGGAEAYLKPWQRKSAGPHRQPASVRPAARCCSHDPAFSSLTASSACDSLQQRLGGCRHRSNSQHVPDLLGFRVYLGSRAGARGHHAGIRGGRD